MWQKITRLAFMLWAIAIAFTDRLRNSTKSGKPQRHSGENGVWSAASQAPGALRRPRRQTSSPSPSAISAWVLGSGIAAIGSP